MVFSVDKVLADLRNVPDYETFRRIVSYIDSNASAYSPHDLDIIRDKIVELKIKKFTPKACSQIRNIYYMTKEGYRSLEWIPLGPDYSVSVCVTAQDLGIPLDEYLFDLYPDMASYKIDMAMPSEYEKELVRAAFPSMEERREIRGRRLAVSTEEMPETELPLAINVAELLERQRTETNELIEAARAENHTEMERLRESIKALRSRLEASTVVPTPSTEREISRILDTSQFNYFQRNIVSLNLPVRTRRVARGEYEISIMVKSPDDEQRVLGFIADVESHAEVKVARGRIRPPGFEEVLDHLCLNYEKHSGMSCGLSRTGALSTLAERLIEYSANHGTEWDKMFDLDSLDLFAKRGSIYTREQADEAFNTAVRQIEGRIVTGRMEEAFAEECSPESLMTYMLDYDAIGGIEVERMLSAIPDRFVELRKEAITALSRCGYYPNRLEDLRSEGDLVFGEMGTTYNDQLAALIDRYVRSYGEGL